MRRAPTGPAGGPGCRRGCRARSTDDSGAAATLFVLGLSVMLLAVAGLMVDGGLAINARERIADDAEQAARAGAQMIDELTLRSTGAVRLDRGAAEAAARTFLQARGYTAVDPEATDNEIVVRVESRERTGLLQLIGIDGFDVSAQATAAAESGVETGDGP